MEKMLRTRHILRVVHSLQSYAMAIGRFPCLAATCSNLLFSLYALSRIVSHISLSRFTYNCPDCDTPIHLVLYQYSIPCSTLYSTSTCRNAH